MSDLTFSLLEVIVSLATVYITLYLVPFIKSQTNTKQLDEVVGMINIAVQAAEQTLKNGKIKKAEVITFITKWMDDKGIKITDEQLDKLIESAVYSMNNSKSEMAANSTSSNE